ncbi:unnamed protein product, partial [Owenia fusiformis]
DKNFCMHLKLSGITDSAFNGIYENRNISVQHRPSYAHTIVPGKYLYYSTTGVIWVVDNDFDDMDGYFAHSPADSGLDPISTHPWKQSLATWKGQYSATLICLDGSTCRRIQLSGMEVSTMNGIYENNNKIIANMPSYTKQS